MLIMILKMLAIIAIHIVITLILWKLFKKNTKMTIGIKILIGVIFGLCAVFSNYFNVNYGQSLLNIRDLSPLVAGLFFDPISGIIAGVIGGVHRFIIGEFFGIGAYTHVACSIATILAGINVAFLSHFIFTGRTPKSIFSFFIGAVTEVVHMYLILITHNDDIINALNVVKNDSLPMILFTSLGLMLTSIVIQIYSREFFNPFKIKDKKDVGITRKFRALVFIFCIVALTGNYIFTYQLQTKATDELANIFVNNNVLYELIEIQGYETMFSNIITLSLLYILISILVERLIINDIHTVNKSLNKITNGNLDEKVSVYSSSEFAELSDDINTMVDSLKGYIEDEKRRNEQELLLSKSIQSSTLPKNFNFERNDFDLYASMSPTKEVGGDFYDFFFVAPNKLALVMADVSGKGFPAALFMMRAKTTIRTIAEQGLSPSEILTQANITMCEGNDDNMFVTVWLGIIDLTTGIMNCANGGHEYPIIKSGDGKYSLYKDKHSFLLGFRPKTKYKEYELTLKKGDAIFLYTDGAPDAENAQEEPYGLDRLMLVLNDNKDDSSMEILKKVKENIFDFSKNSEQFDDITMLGFKYLG